MTRYFVKVLYDRHVGYTFGVGVVTEVGAGTLEPTGGCDGTAVVAAAVDGVVVAADGDADEAIKEEVDDNDVATAVDVLNGSTAPKGEIPGKPGGGLPRPANKELGPPIFG